MPNSNQSEKTFNILGVNLTQEEAETYLNWTREEGAAIQRELLVAAKTAAGGRSNSIGRPTYEAGPGQRRMVPWEYTNDERMQNVGQVVALENMLMLPKLVEQEIKEQSS